MILITGCARSGTSLTTQILQAHGVHLGTPINGLYENTDIREKVVKPYLRSIGADPLGQKPLPDTNNLKPFPELSGQVLRYMGRPVEPWAYKCAKLVLMWPLWKEAFPEAKYVLVRRPKEAIADSCVRTSFMKAYQDRDGWRHWVEEHEKRFEDMKRALPVVEVWPDRFIEEPSAFEAVTEFLGLPFDLKAVERSIDRPKWH